MSRFKGYFALLIFLFCIGITYESSFAEDGETNAAEGQGGGYYATSAECSSGIAEVLIAIVAAKSLVLPLLSSIVSCIYNSVTGNAAGALVEGAKIALYTTGITLIFMSLSTSLQCLFAFVRDPILRDPQNKKPMKLNEKGEKITVKRWEAEKIPFSDVVEVCARPSIPYVSVVAVLPDGKTPMNHSCYHTAQKDYFANGTDYNMNYDGKDAFLCPEEWRTHGYTRGKDNVAYIVNEENIKNASLLDAKQNDGPLTCETHKLGDDPFTIHGYKYQIIKRGAKLCAKLISLGELPSLAGQFIVGCHYGPPDPPAPLCASSTEVNMEKKDDNNNILYYPTTEALVKQKYPQTINPGKYVGQPIYINTCEDNSNLDSCTNVIIDWDNGKCFSCYVSDSCYANSAMHAQSIFPVTSYVMECLTSSLQAVMFGCKGTVTPGGGSGNTPGMFHILNKNLAYISYILITIAISLFGIKMLLAGHIPKVQEVMAMLFKIMVVLFFVHGDDEKQGMMWLYKQMTGLSSGLSTLMLDAGNANGSCVFDDSAYPTSPTLSYLYLKPFDILDCKAFFYLGGKLLSEDDAKKPNAITNNMALKLLEIVFPLIFLFDFLGLFVGIFLLFFALMMIAIIIWIVSLIVLSTIFVFILILITPIIIPMILFDYTKGFFDAWVKELLAYMLFPVFIYLFFSLMVITLDKPMFGATEFKNTGNGPKITGVNSSAYFAYVKKDCKNQYERMLTAFNSNNLSSPVIGANTVPLTIEDAINDPNNKIDDACRYCLTIINPDKFDEICDGCDLKGLACNMRTWNTKASTTFIGGVSTIKPDQSNNSFYGILESCGYIVMLILLFLTLLKAITMIVAKLVGGSQTLRKIASHGVDPIGSFTKLSGVVTTPIRATKTKAVNALKNMKNKKGGSDSKSNASDNKGGGGPKSEGGIR